MDPGHDTEDVDVNSDDLGVVVVGQSNSSVPSGQSLKYTFLDNYSFKSEKLPQTITSSILGNTLSSLTSPFRWFTQI